MPFLLVMIRCGARVFIIITCDVILFAMFLTKFTHRNSTKGEQYTNHRNMVLLLCWFVCLVFHQFQDIFPSWTMSFDTLLMKWAKENKNTQNIVVFFVTWDALAHFCQVDLVSVLPCFFCIAFIFFWEWRKKKCHFSASVSFVRFIFQFQSETVQVGFGVTTKKLHRLNVFEYEIYSDSGIPLCTRLSR